MSSLPYCTRSHTAFNTFVRLWWVRSHIVGNVRTQMHADRNSATCEHQEQQKQKQQNRNSTQRRKQIPFHVIRCHLGWCWGPMLFALVFAPPSCIGVRTLQVSIAARCLVDFSYHWQWRRSSSAAHAVMKSFMKSSRRGTACHAVFCFAGN